MIENINYDELKDNSYSLNKDNYTEDTALVIFDFIGEENIINIQELYILKKVDNKYIEVFNINDLNDDYTTRLVPGYYLIKSKELGEETLIIDDLNDVYKICANYLENSIFVEKINDIN